MNQQTLLGKGAGADTKKNIKMLKKQSVLQILKDLECGVKIKEVAKSHRVGISTVTHILSGRTWSNATKYQDICSQRERTLLARERNPSPVNMWGESHHASKLSEKDICDIFLLLLSDTPHEDIASKYGLKNKGSLGSIISGNTWNDPSMKEIKKLRQEYLSTRPPRKKQKPRRLLNIEEVKKILMMIADGYTHAEISTQFKMSSSSVGAISKGKTWPNEKYPELKRLRKIAAHMGK